MNNKTLSPFRTKICGANTAASINAVDQSGADAVGLNFYPNGPRFLPESEWEAVLEAFPKGLLRVGVFVDSTVAEINRINAIFQLDYIQLHGNEPAEMLGELKTPVIRAFRGEVGGFGSISSFLGDCERIGVALPEAVLVDSHKTGQYGGTGKVLDWEKVSTWRESIGTNVPLILAGGLDPANVAEAIQLARPCGVDTASGVELSEPGIKDFALSAQFVEAAKAAFDSAAI